MQVFGISFFYTENDYMKEELLKNDLVVIRETSVDEICENDIIAYKINGKVRINRIINIEYDYNMGKNRYTTKTDNSYYPDIENIYFDQIIGKKIINIHILGIMLRILQSKVTTLLIMIILFLIFYINENVYKNQLQRKKKKRKFVINKNT